MRLAVHEAAHGVIGWHVGLDVLWLSLEPGRGECRYARTIWQADVWPVIVALLAGPVAARRYDPADECVDPGCASDRAKVGALLSSRPVIEQRITRARAEATAGRLVDTYWRPIVTIAAALEQRGRLTWDEASRVVALG